MSFLKAKPLPHEILCDPEIFFDWEVIPGKARKVQEINDEYFVLNISRGLTFSKIFTFLFGGLVTLVIFSLQLIGKNGGGELLGLTMFCLQLLFLY